MISKLRKILAVVLTLVIALPVSLSLSPHTKVQASTNDWTQTNWSAGPGNTSNDGFSVSSNVDYTEDVHLLNEHFDNGQMNADLHNWAVNTTDPVTDNPILTSYYNFYEEGGGKVHDLQGRNDGTIVNGVGDPFTSLGGKIGPGYQFSGNTNGIQIGSSSDLDTNFGDTFSIGFWVKYHTGTGVDDAHDATLMSKYVDGVGGFYVTLHGDNIGAPSVTLVDDLGATSQATYNHNMGDDNWHYIVVTRDNSAAPTSDLKIYVDGVTENTPSDAVAYAQSHKDLSSIQNTHNLILNQVNNGTQPINLDEVSLWSAALDQTQIDTLYNSGTGFNPAFSIARDTPTLLPDQPSAKLTPLTSPVNLSQDVTFADSYNHTFSTLLYTDGSDVTSDDAILVIDNSPLGGVTYTPQGDGWTLLEYDFTATATINNTYTVQVLPGRTVYVSRLSLGGYYDTGYIRSRIFDLSPINTIGSIQYTATGSGDTGLSMRVRTGTTANLSDAPDFSTCNDLNPDDTLVTSTCVHNGDRFIQYLMTLTSTDGINSPSVTSVSISYNATSVEITSPLTNTNVYSTHFRLSGAGLANTDFTIEINGATVDTVHSNSAGNWTKVLNVTSGGQTIKVIAPDTAFSQIVISATDTVAINSPADGGTVATTDTVVTGVAIPSSTVTVKLDGTTVGTTDSDNTGSWTYSLSGLSETSHTVTASVRFGRMLYILSANSIQLLNTTTNLLAGSIDLPAGGHFSSFVVSHDGAFIYVADSTNDDILVYDTATQALIDTIGIAGSPSSMAISWDDATLAVSDDSSPSDVWLIDTSSDTITHDMQVVDGILDFTNNMTFSKDNSKLYLFLDGDTSGINVVDVASATVTTTITDPDGGYYGALNFDGSMLYVGNTVTPGISVIDTSTDMIVRSNTFPPSPFYQPYRVIVSRDESKLYLVDQFGSGELRVVDVSSLSPVATISTIGVSLGETFPYNTTNKLYFVTDNAVQVLDTGTSTLDATSIPLLGGPVDIAATPILGTTTTTSTFTVSVPVPPPPPPPEPPAPPSDSGSQQHNSQQSQQTTTTTEETTTTTPTVTPAETSQTYALTVKVTDENGNPVTGATVTIASTLQTAVTDTNGQVKFAKVAGGTHELTIVYNGTTTTKQIVLSANTVVTEKIQVAAPPPASSFPWLPVIAGSGAGLGALAWWFSKRAKLNLKQTYGRY